MPAAGAHSSILFSMKQPTTTSNHLATKANASSDSIRFIPKTYQNPRDFTQTREDILRDRAVKRMERRIQNHDRAEEISRAADVLLECGNYAGASGGYIEATYLWPSNPEYYLKLTQAYIKCGLYADAAHAATRALSFDPTYIKARYERGVARLEQGLLLAAKIDFETVIAHSSSHIQAHTKLERTLVLLEAAKDSNYIPLPPYIDADGEPVDYSFPHYDDNVLELVELSDSSDCNHVGKGVPCRFYNHHGCVRGAQCDFSHAPDERSVRDGFGRNVCIYYLLSSCKFGDIKCVYSHSKEALPVTFGWWNDVEQIQHVKEVLDLADKKTKERRALEWSLYKLESKKKAKANGKNKTLDRTRFAKAKEYLNKLRNANETALEESKRDGTLEKPTNEMSTAPEVSTKQSVNRSDEEPTVLEETQ